MIVPPLIDHSSNPTRASLGSPVVDEFTNNPSPATKSTPTKRSLRSSDKGITQLTHGMHSYHALFPLLVFFLTIFHISISSPEPPPKMRRQSNRKKTIPPSSKGVPEIEHTTDVAAKHLPSLPSPENIDASEKGTEAQLQEMDNTKSLPGQSGPERKGDEVRLSKVSSKLSDNQDKFSPNTKTPLKSAQNDVASDEDDVKESRVIEVHSTKEQVNSTEEQVHSIEERGKNDESSSLGFSSSKQQLPNDSRLATTGRSETDPVLDTGSKTLSMFQQIGTPTFTMPHSAAAQVLDTNCTRRKIEFHNSNWPIVCDFYATQDDKSDEVPQVYLLNCNHNVSFNSTVVSEIIFNYSKSEAPRLSDSKHMSNADSDMKSFLASTNCSPAHPIEDLITLVPLVQTLQDDPSPISTRPLDMQGDWGTTFFKKWERVLKVNSFTDEGKMVWAKACGLEEEFKALLSNFADLKLHPDAYINGNVLLTSYKNRLFYSFLHQHHQPPFRLDNAEGKHRRLAYCCLAAGRFIDPITGSISSTTDLTYRHFAKNGIISKDKCTWPNDTTFLVELDNVLNGTVRCHAMQKCSTVEVYYITSLPHEVPTSDVMSALITLSKQISDGKLASNRPHPMDLCAQFVKTLAKKVDVSSLETTPNMADFPFDNTLYMTTSAVEKLIKANGTAEPSESSLMKYFKQLDEQVVQEFVAHPSNPQYESAFLNYFTYLAHNDSTKRMRPPFVNSFKSLVKDPSASTYGESTIEPDQKASKFPKINILTTSRINRIYFAIKVFNYIYASFKNVSLEEAETPEAKSLLNFILRYYVNAKTSSQTHLIHGAGPIWYKDVIPPKSLYFNFHEAHIIGATILIASLIDSAFDHPDEHRATSSKPTSTDNTLRQFKNHLISLAAGFSTMNDALNFSVKDILYNLSKSYEIVS